eukprot:1150715-Pelagomonas_calceolata.AAC.4
MVKTLATLPQQVCTFVCAHCTSLPTSPEVHGCPCQSGKDGEGADEVGCQAVGADPWGLPLLCGLIQA